MGCSRIDQYYAGKGKRIKTDTRYKIIGGGENWKMVIEKGIDARPRMITDGIDAFVSVRENTDGTYTYTLARQSEFVPSVFSLTETKASIPSVIIRGRAS